LKSPALPTGVCDMSEINIGIIGAGAWGINHVRTFNQLPGCDVVKVSDLSPQNLEKVKGISSNINVTDDYHEIISDPAINAVVIATTSDTHYSIAKEALLNNKHAFVEKPLCLNLSESEELIKISDEKNLTLMVGHLLLYHPVINWIKEYIDKGEIGDIHYIYSHRLNLGKVRTTENALWSLAPHDISVMLYLVDSPVVKSHGVGKSFINKGIEDLFFFSLEFANGVLGHGHVSWLDPNKTRKFTIVGSKKMIIFDDVASSEKIKIYDKGVFHKEYGNYGESLSLRDGDIYSPAIKVTEPLKIECQHFLDCIKSGTKPLSDGVNGLNVTKVLLEISPL
jgi:predicted dehydrogenase